MIQIYGRKKCRGSQKASRFFKDRGVKVQELDLDDHPLGARELETLAQALGGYEALIDKEGETYRKRGLAHMEFDPKEALLDDPRLLATPLVRLGRVACRGADEPGWARLAAQEKA